MKKFFVLISTTILLLMLIACVNKQTYRYVEIVKEKRLLGQGYDTKEKEANVFEEASDSAAYLQAFEWFCIAQKVHHDMLDGGYGEVDIPQNFKLYNEKGEDITDVYFSNKTIKEQEIMAQISSQENSLKKAQRQGNHLGDWRIDNYVDEFQEKTDERYIYQTSLGTFSNSATTNSDLLARILIDKKQIRLRLQEYAHHYVKESATFMLRVKSGDDTVSDFSMWANSDGYIEFMSYHKDEEDSLRHILLRGGEVRFYGVINHYGKSTYNFSFKADCLQNAIAEMEKATEVETTE